MDSIQDYIDKLETTIIKSSNDLYEIEDLCEELDDRSDKSLAITALFKFLENNAHEDLGSPGAIVKLLEQFPEIYKHQLYNSIDREPTFYNLWMLNRHLNAIENSDEKAKGIQVLKSIVDNVHLSNYIRGLAMEFLKNH
jgi:hypothetical protein